MQTILLITQVLVAIALIGLVLIQQGKGADAGAAFGSGASGTVFGSRGTANFLSRATAVLAALFFAISLGLAYLVQGGGGASSSVVDQLKSPPTQSQTAPAKQPLASPSSSEVPAKLGNAQSDTSGSSSEPNDVPAAPSGEQAPDDKQ